ncbi:MAG: LacI family transcriptional regulator [Verrucomicrobiales bacterium]|jgi:DNA-binding LacI/PurR family transcriptional regulator|nr:LacI family transcriptional regulator [Verrucomicrobiales bacterium]
MATLKDIALSLNLSTMAVSKAMRNAPDISKATKDRVMSEARRLGYIPNQMARSLRGGSSGLVGVVVPLLSDVYAAKMVQGLEEEASARGYQVLIGSSHGNVSRELELVNGMIGRRVEALFVYPMARIEQRRALLDLSTGRDVPIVFFHRYPAAASLYKNVGWVVADAQQGAEKITEYLLSKGHREMVYLSGEPASSFAAEHQAGYRRALMKAGLSVNDNMIFMAGSDIAGGSQAMARVLAEGTKFSAVIAISDSAAIGACEVLRKQGFKIPQDVSVVGFGDGALAEYYSAPLTTIHQSHADMGKAAFNLWQQSLKAKDSLSGRHMAVELIERGSVERVNLKK